MTLDQAVQSLWDIKFCMHTNMHNSKLQVICRCSTYETTALLPELSTFCVRAAYKILLASFSSKHASQCLCDMPVVFTYTHNSKTFQFKHRCSTYQTIALLSKTFSLYVFELNERSEWRATAPDAHCGRSLIQHFVCKPVHTLLFGT